VNITVTSGKNIPSNTGESILESLKKSGIFLTSSCGGKGTCGKCKVVVQSGAVESTSQMKLSQDEINTGYALACKTYPSEDILIDIPKESMLIVEGQIATGKSKDLQALMQSSGAEVDPIASRILLELPPPTIDDNISDLERLKRELTAQGLGCLRVPHRFLTNLGRTVREGNWEITLSTMHSEDCYEITNIFAGDQTSPHYGIAVDIGTTTVVVYMIDLTDGNLLDVASIYNSQIQYGDDVITRIVNATEHDQLKSIHRAVVSDINNLLQLLMESHNITSDAIDCFVTSGNTTMTQLFLNLDPASIREEPYIPTANSFPLSYAGELGIKANPNTPVYVLPGRRHSLGGPRNKDA
jgi:uncharacterized 2Fe-2S/4Fe-4S cluster protein (DUF4445 family)